MKVKIRPRAGVAIVGIDGAVDAELKIIADKKNGLIRVFLNNAKFGEDKISTYWQLDKSYHGVRVPMQIKDAQFVALGAKLTAKGEGEDEGDDTAEKSEATIWRDLVRKTIVDTRATIDAAEAQTARELNIDIDVELMKSKREFTFLNFAHGKKRHRRGDYNPGSKWHHRGKDARSGPR
jgi:hypothetical protein